MTRTALRICPLCEATCGLELTVSDDGAGRVTAARGDRDDVFSAGFVCPKGASFGELDGDPDRLTRPLVRRDGQLTEVGWDEAFAVVADRLGAVIAEHGGASVGVYLGNPNAHTMAGALYPPLVIRALGTRNVFSASTLDQMPKQVALGHMFGNPFAFTVPDLDRTDHLVVIGANPMVSNGSLATAADFPGKLRALRKRGGRLTVIDPARTRTAELADRHLAPRPGTDGRPAVRRRARAVRRRPGGRGSRRDRRARGRAWRPSGPWPTSSPRRWWPPTAALRPKTFGSWPGRSRPHRRRRCTGGSAPRPSSSAPWAAGWSTSSTS